MAAFKRRCAGVEIKINDVDHEPPHCHLIDDGRNVKVDLYTLEPFSPAGATLTKPERKCLEAAQAELLAAWEDVTILISGPGAE